MNHCRLFYRDYLRCCLLYHVFFRDSYHRVNHFLENLRNLYYFRNRSEKGDYCFNVNKIDDFSLNHAENSFIQYNLQAMCDFNSLQLLKQSFYQNFQIKLNLAIFLMTMDVDILDPYNLRNKLCDGNYPVNVSFNKLIDYF